METVIEKPTTGEDIRNQRFIEGLLKHGGDASMAYRKAGYKASKPNAIWSAASRKLRDVKVQEAIRQIKAMSELKQEEIANGLLKEAHAAPHSRDRISAWSWLGKAKGMFHERVTHDVEGLVFAWKGELGSQKPIEGEILYNSPCTQLPVLTESKPLPEEETPEKEVGGVPEKDEGVTLVTDSVQGHREAKKE